MRTKSFLSIVSVICLFMSLLTLTGCKHASDRHSRTKSSYARTEDTRSRETRSRRERSRDESVSVPSSSRHGRTKMEGAEIFERYGSAVFMIFTSDGYHNFQGSGFFINNRGLAVSNYHVFQGTTIGKEQIKFLGDDRAYSISEVIHKSSDEDFILFRVDCSSSNYIPIASSKPKIGEKVFAIGSPRGLENTFSSGEVSQWRGDNLMQISALIDHGSSGGALINEYGEIVGITSGSFADGSQANLNYAWSIEAVKPYLK